MKFTSLFAALGVAVWKFAAAEDWHPASLSRDQAQSLLSHVGSCCSGLSLFLGDKVAGPSQSGYNSSIGSYFSAQEQALKPDCVVTPTGKEDVSLAVFILNLGSQLFPGKCDFAIRSGGHTPYSGAANIASGIVLDLQNLNQVTLSDDKTTVEIGPGNRWVNVYTALEEHGLSTVGGRVSTVGVGGLVTGGGISFFSPRYGYVCDNVQNFEVVLSSGKIVNANASSNPSLWRALKGGSNNFGVVTAITLPAFEQGGIWGGQLGVDISALGDIFAAFESFTGNPDYDPYSALICTVAWIAATDTWLIVHSLEYTKAVENPAVFANFTSLEPQFLNTLRIDSLSGLTAELGAGVSINTRQTFASATFRNSAVLMAALHEISQAATQRLTAIPSLQWMLTFQPIPSIINAKAASTGGNSLGLHESDGNLINVLLNPIWGSEEDDEQINAQIRLFFELAEAKAKELDAYHPFIYLNYADSWQDPIDGYGVETKQALQETSKKYDPTGLFQKNVPGGFKLFK